MKRQPPPPENHERWLVSYADFITLLFAFFVVLYSSSKADAHKQAQISASIDSAFRALGLFQGVSKSPGSGPGLPAPGTLPHLEDGQVSSMNIVMGDQLMATDVQQDFAKIKQHLDGLLSNQIAQHIVSLKIGRDGLVISLREAGFYDSGSAEPHQSSIATLDQIAAALCRSLRHSD
jgi:chemotaxis protein MotB